jgi:predicted transposase YbfD/YdcC
VGWRADLIRGRYLLSSFGWHLNGEQRMRSVKSDDVVSIMEFFKDLEDPRSTVNRQHLLGDLIVICVLAVIAGADGPKAIGIWASSKLDWLKHYLKLSAGVPSHDTIGRLLAALKPQAFQKCFQQWLASLGENGDPAEDDTRQHIAIDGKALRRSHDHHRNLGPLFLVSAWPVRRGISLGQLATAEKSNEITAIPELLDHIDVTKAVVTIDAAGCQREIAEKVVDGGGDYILALKGNQEKLHQAVQDYVVTNMENDFADILARKYEEVVKAHGRVDSLTYYQMPTPDSLINRDKWKGLKTIGVAIRVSKQGDKETSDVRYYISSDKMGVRRFAKNVRGHWGIENTLHWCLDVTFREDDSRLRNRNAADNMAWLRRFAISVLKQQTDRESIAMRRRMAGWNSDYLSQLLGISSN